MKSNLYWINGLSGAGKTTIGSLFHSHLLDIKKNIVYLDGDILREIFGDSKNFSQSKRKFLAKRYSRLCKVLTEQGTDVIIINDGSSSPKDMMYQLIKKLGLNNKFKL